MTAENKNDGNPLVTVLLPVHNAAAFLHSAIESILSQTFSDFEFLIINDGSTDESKKIIQSFSDPRICFIENDSNIGLIATLNRGIKIAKGKFIARMDGDDISLPARLQKQVEKLQADPAVAVVASFVDFINEDGEITGTWNTDREAVSEEQIRALMMRTNCIAHPSVMMRKDVVEKFLYSSNQKGAEDWDLWMRILASGYRIVKIPETLLQYRVHPASITVQLKSGESLERRLMRVKRKFLFRQISKLKINRFYFGVKFSCTKNFVRHLVSNKFPKWGRDIKRFLTSSPFRVYSEGRKFSSVLGKYSGRHFFIFPYTHVGGAEKVHAAIVASVADQKPIVIFSGFSQNKKFLERFTAHAEVLDVAHFINYPLTRKKAIRKLAAKINSTNKAVVLGSNAGLFYDIIPEYSKDVKVIDLIHAFKYQPGANLTHLRILPFTSRIDQRIFVSQAALQEFEKFYFHNNIPKRIAARLHYISNGIPIPAEPDYKAHNPLGVLFVGRESEEKRLWIFVKLADNFRHENLSRFKFLIAGVQGGYLPQEYYLGEITNEKKMQEIYTANDFLLVTSSREGFPMVIMEAMMNGLVVISTPVGDIPNRLNGENGIVVSGVDEKSVREEMKDWLEKLSADPEKILKIKRAARKYAVENFSEEKFNKEYRKLLEANP
jgi:glycosyltransferase involved in cell wall biosynthesis